MVSLISICSMQKTSPMNLNTFPACFEGLRGQEIEFKGPRQDKKGLGVA